MKKNLQIKVCGLKYSDNIIQIANICPDFMGFIFYEKSSRYVGKSIEKNVIERLPVNIIKTGVFVNETIQNILNIAKNNNLDAIQLHGNEDEKFCKTIKDENLIIIKSFRINIQFDFRILEVYNDCCNYFLFDTYTDLYGGSGKKFDWNILSERKINVPFFLSGGISAEDVGNIKNLNIPNLFGIDINSKFEISPGVKDIEKVKKFIKTLRS
jgi:phosphoribosylanthranilate isomerase